MAALAGRLARDGRLRRGVSRRRATDVLALATSFAIFDELARSQDLSVPEIQRLLRALVERTLFPLNQVLK